MALTADNSISSYNCYVNVAFQLLFLDGVHVWECKCTMCACAGLNAC